MFEGKQSLSPQSYELVDMNEESDHYGKALLKEKINVWTIPEQVLKSDAPEDELVFHLICAPNGWFLEEVCERVEKIHSFYE